MLCLCEFGIVVVFGVGVLVVMVMSGLIGCGVSVWMK